MPVLTPELKQKIEAYIPRYPNKQAVTLPALHLVQDALRCVPAGAVREIAEILELAPAEVYDTMSFYGIFRDEDKKLGRNRLWVCRSLACHLRGADQLLEHFSNKLHVMPGETTRDGKVTLEFAECIGACEGAPCVLINDEHEHDVNTDKADKLIERLRA
jgi:NADH-quinone oxidoreductase subunit E